MEYTRYEHVAETMTNTNNFREAMSRRDAAAGGTLV
jgi:hypothetical protein